MKNFLLVIAILLAVASSSFALEFSATVICGQSKASRAYVSMEKVYISGDKMRIENFPFKKNAVPDWIEIVDNKQEMWTLSPAKKSCQRTFMILGNYLAYKDHRPGNPIGREKIAGIWCDKYKDTNKSLGRINTDWLSNDGLWMKSTVKTNETEVTVFAFTSIKYGAQPASLFEIPKGYKKT